MRYEVKVTTTQTYTVEAVSESAAAFTALETAEGYTNPRPGRLLDRGEAKHAVNVGDVRPTEG